MKRVFLIVLDSFGIGEMPDAEQFGDCGSNTLYACYQTGDLHLKNLSRLGLYHIEGISFGDTSQKPLAAYARMTEASAGKDTTIGHWEISGVISPKPLPTYPNGFPPEIIQEFEKQTGKKVLCNEPYSGTEVLKDFGEQHLKTGNLIVYTSADSVFQIAAHEDIVPTDMLYHYCEIARSILKGSHGVGRVIARPFIGSPGCFRRTVRRHDFSLLPPSPTILDGLQHAGLQVIGIGKINDIYAGKGITKAIPTTGNADGMRETKDMLHRDFQGLCFTNLVDFDMLYGHRNDTEGYTAALNEFDRWLGEMLSELKDEDVLMITADHGCDPSTPSTDHSREYTPLLIYGASIKPVNLGTRASFADIGKTISDIFKVNAPIQGQSFWEDIHR